TLDDGAAGCAAVHRHGGLVIAQDPAEAAFPGMPVAALQAVPDAIKATIALIARTVDEQARERKADARKREPKPEIRRRVEWLLSRRAEDAEGTLAGDERLSCPE